jgi:hypothetical protein
VGGAPGAADGTQIAVLIAARLHEAVMTQSVLNSGQFRRSTGVNAAAAVSLLDVPPTAAVDTRPYAFLPLAAVAVGGILTIVWDCFLLWLVARVIIYWLD